ncbi:hypothetical protein Taro_053530 [Colocasia esculenta]|uniref:Alpha-soluble NSF attachment protein n=1 Tax=Colocasia esculenta TaxID=4460 RepID=A0A843XL92_COLES|nr:hypothetical protein [Colocasia esculenta]
MHKSASVETSTRPQGRHGRADSERGGEFEKQAEKYEDAADLYSKAANCYKLGKNWDKAKMFFVKLAKAYLKLDSKHEAASAFVDAANCYKKAAKYLNEAMNLFLEIGQLNMAARYSKEVGDVYEQGQDLEKAREYFQRAADLFQSEEAIARQYICSNLLKYGVKGLLLNTGLCQLCRGDVVAITNSLERFQDLDPTFSGTREYKFLAKLCYAKVFAP